VAALLEGREASCGNRACAVPDRRGARVPERLRRARAGRRGWVLAARDGLNR
jgi:hypothetical protein